MKNRRLLMIMLVVVLLILTPFLAMQFTDEVAWSTMDFVVAGILLFGTGLLLEIILKNIRKTSYKVSLIIALLIVLLLIWVELAVGIVGTPFGGA